jgi:hypothetical protein
MTTAAEAIQDATLRANALALLARMGEVIEGVGDKPIQWHPSMLKLVQATTNTDTLPSCKPGDFVLSNEVLKTMDVVPLRIWTTRDLWPEDLGSDRRLCESPDGITGWKYGDCRTCQFSQWNEENNKVPCTKSLKFLVIKADLSDIFLINFSKTGYRGGMNFEKLVKSTKTHIYRRSYTVEASRHPENKNVFLTSVSFSAPGSFTLSPDVEAFLRELFSYSGESRRHQLEAFQAGVERRATMSLENKSGATRIGDDSHRNPGDIVIEGTAEVVEREDASVRYEV